MTAGEGRAPDQARSEDSVSVDMVGCAHEVATGFFALDIGINEAVETANIPLGRLKEEDLTYLRENLQVIQRQVVTQLCEAQNFLAHAAPQFTDKLRQRALVKTNLLDLLDPMLTLYRERAARRSIDIRFERARGSPSIQIQVDEDDIRRVFHNVLSNAFKYSYHGKNQKWRFIRIWCGWATDTRPLCWALHFENYGTGVLDSERSLVFQPGYRGEMARRERTVGAGLGLSEVMKCMKRHRGRVELESNRRHEEVYLTTVSLLFPIH